MPPTSAEASSTSQAMHAFSYPRFNTRLDPVWKGFLTVELANLGDEEVVYRTGSPLGQVKFEWLDEPTEIPYQGNI